ncbi:hypothetical protein QNE21_004208 [Vibrio vulnificus]|nr:hypothetical protein [Vibrio vulnificus]POB67130.1 hypothetical protein CRN59_27220 [Vibrio vulnificus]HAU8272386.1 hypothetical protein [Vibrio vulnificus]HDY7818841.1 hypothetical protein [Vibrio vulnificus]
MSGIELVNDLREKLLKAGYPEEAIRVEYASPYNNSEYSFVDLAVVDPSTGGVLAVFEVKKSRQKSPSLLNKASQQIIAYSKHFQSNTQCFVYADEAGKRTLAVVNLGSKTLTVLKEIPSFDSLRNTNIAQERTAKKRESKKVIDSFVITCYLLAVCVGIILVLDLIGVYSFSSQQLTLLAVVGALFIIPHAAKIKILGLEFERHHEAKEKNT